MPTPNPPPLHTNSHSPDFRVYVGQTRSRDLIRRLESLGLGECTNRGELPPRRRPFFYDNGAYSDHSAGRSFNVCRWLRDLRWMTYRGVHPDFICLPDRVGGGVSSLNLSLEWRVAVPAELRDRCYLAVQDGLTEADVAVHLHMFAGLFVGGTLAWKLATAQHWIDLAHRHGRACHIGRVGTPSRLLWAHALGADSVDSALPIRHEHHLRRFIQALRAIPSR